MDRSELVTTLRCTPVPDALMRQRSPERVLGRCTTEDEACDPVHARLTELPPPAPDAAERIAEVLVPAVNPLPSSIGCRVR